jgi:hypothetical protein
VDPHSRGTGSCHENAKKKFLKFITETYRVPGVNHLGAQGR